MATAGNVSRRNCRPHVTSLTDEALVKRVADGGAEALGELYDRHGGVAYGLAYTMLRDSGEAADVVQEAFVSLWRSAARFDPARGSARNWLLTVVRNGCIGRMRGRRPNVGVDDPDVGVMWMSSPDDVAETVARRLQADDVRRAVEQLPAEQRATIGLAYFQGMTHAQIAAEMQVPLGTVKGRMRLALDKLKDMLAVSGERRER